MAEGFDIPFYYLPVFGLALMPVVLLVLRRVIPKLSGWEVLKERFAEPVENPGKRLGTFGLVAMRLNALHSHSAISIGIYEGGVFLKPRFFFAWFLSPGLFIPFSVLADGLLDTAQTTETVAFKIDDQRIEVRGPAATTLLAELEAFSLRRASDERSV